MERREREGLALLRGFYFTLSYLDTGPRMDASKY